MTINALSRVVIVTINTLGRVVIVTINSLSRVLIVIINTLSRVVIVTIKSYESGALPPPHNPHTHVTLLFTPRDTVIYPK